MSCCSKGNTNTSWKEFFAGSKFSAGGSVAGIILGSSLTFLYVSLISQNTSIYQHAIKAFSAISGAGVGAICGKAVESEVEIYQYRNR